MALWPPLLSSALLTPLQLQAPDLPRASGWGASGDGPWLVLRWARCLSRPKGRASQREGRAHTEQRREMQPGEAEARAPGAVEGVRPPDTGPQRLRGQWAPRCRLGVREGVWGERFQEDPVMSPRCRPGILQCDHVAHAQRLDS